MKNMLGNWKKIVPLLTIIVLLIVLFTVYFTNGIYSSTLPNTPAPGTPRFISITPSGPPVGSPAAPGAGAPLQRSGTRSSSPTKVPISKTTDLAKGLPDTEKHVFIVRRANGTYEEFLIANSFYGDIAAFRQFMGLSPQDVIVDDRSLVPKYSTPPPPTIAPTNATPKVNPYP